MSIFDFLKKTMSQFQQNKEVSEKQVHQPSSPISNSNLSAKVEFDNSTPENVSIQTTTNTYSVKTEYVRLSTSGDDNVCPMCKQFEGKIFLSTDAPKLPLCPSCSCGYLYYFEDDLPADSQISHKEDFTLPADCVSQFYKHQNKVFEESNINKQIQMLQKDLKKLSEFMIPYISANFEAPCELACRDLLPDLYMKIGKWDKAEQTIKLCIEAQAYYPENGSAQLSEFESYRDVATSALSYISENPGCLQRNIYKKLPYEGLKKEQLKHFLRYSHQIYKEKSGNTNKLFVKQE